MPSKEPGERRLAARIAAHESWKQTKDRRARTLPGHNALLAKFEAEVDPQGELTADERERRARNAMAAHMARLQLKSARVRRAAKADPTGKGGADNAAS